MENSETLMTAGSIRGHILQFALPLMLGNLFQQLYNAVDSVIVGRFIGSSALAAVSSSGNLIFLVVGFFIGIANGAGVVIAYCLGSGDRRRTETAVHTAVAIGLAGSALLTVLGTVFAVPVLRMMNTPPEVLKESAVYFRVYFSGSLGFVMYNVFVGILQASGDSRHPLIYLVVSSVINAVLDLALVAGLHMGVGAAAFATIMSQVLSALLCMNRLLRTEGAIRFIPSKIRLNRSMTAVIMRQGLPSGLQNSIMSFSNVVIQSYINTYGAYAMAGIGAYIKIEAFTFIPITSFSMALTTFVSQNLGAREYGRIGKGVRFGVLTTVITAQVLGVTLMIFARQLVGLFDSTPEVIYYGMMRARIVTPFFFLCAATHSLAAVLRGLGKPVIPMFVFLFAWCAMRILILVVADLFVHTIVTTYAVYPVTWTISTTAMLICAARERRVLQRETAA